MGTTSTGIYTTFYENPNEGIESLEDVRERNEMGQGFTINNGILSTSTYDQSARRTFRASRKALKRRKNSKRLALLILNSLGISLSESQEETLRFLMNRRGFTYLEVEAKDQEKMHNLYFSLEEESFRKELAPAIEKYNSLVNEKKWISSEKWNHLKELLKDNPFPFGELEEPFDLWVVTLTFLFQTFLEEKEKDKSFILEEELTEALLETFLDFQNKGRLWFALYKKQEKEKGLKEKDQDLFSSLSLDLEDAQILLTIEKKMEGKILKESLEAILKEFKEGKRSREKAFLELKGDLENPQTSAYTLFKESIEPKLSLEEFMNLLANTINLQNRYFRQYFQYGKDYPFPEKGDTWQSERAYLLYQKYIKRVFKSNRKEIFSYLEDWQNSDKKENFAWALTQIPYQKTIPPFESNNNRQTPKCSHIYLNWAWLVHKLQGRENLLKNFTDQLQALYPPYAQDLPVFPLGKEKQTLLWVKKESLIFHRFLDSTAFLLKSILEKLDNSYEIRSNKKLLYKPIIHRLSLSDPEKDALINLVEEAKKEQNHIKKLEKDIIFQEKGVIQELSLSLAYAISNASSIEKSPFILCDNHPPLKKKRKNSYLQKYFSFGEAESLVFFDSLQRRYIKEESVKKGALYTHIEKLKSLRNSLGNLLNLRFLSCQKNLKKLSRENIDKIPLNTPPEESPLTEREKDLILTITYLSDELYSVYTRSLRNKGMTPLEREEISPWKNRGESFALKKEKKYYEIERSFLIHPSLILQLADILLSSKGSGFAKECNSCHCENQWRSSFEEEEEVEKGLLVEGQRCLPLSKGGEIPFSGKVRRFCDALSLRMTKSLFPLLKDQLEKWDRESLLKLNIPLFVEKNSFSFEESLKRSRGKKKESENEKNLLAVQKPLSEIKISPYSGRAITEGNKELDHILSRSYSRSLAKGLVFNSEVNLIPCRDDDNRQKSHGWYSLEELNFEHMKEVFGSYAKEGDYSQIREFIRERLTPYFEKKKKYHNFKRLSEEDKRAFRYVLFTWQDNFLTFEEKEAILFHVLKMSTRTLINGTQKYFLQSLKKKWNQALLRYQQEREIPEDKLNISFTLSVIDCTDYRSYLLHDLRYDLRKSMGNIQENLGKEEIQTPYSHILDSYIIYNVGYFFNNSISTKEAKDKIEKLGEREQKFLFEKKDQEDNSFALELVKCIPKSYQIHFMDSLEMVSERKTNKASKQLFKTTFYAQRFLPLIITEKGLGFGFSPNNSFISDPDGFNSPLYTLLYPYLKNKEGLPTPQEIEEGVAFGPCYPYLKKLDGVRVQKFLTESFHKEQENPEAKGINLEEIFSSLSYRTTRMGLDPALPLKEFEKMIKDKDILKVLIKEPLKLNSFFQVKFKTFGLKKDKKQEWIDQGKDCLLELPYIRTWRELEKLYRQEKEETPEECLRKALENLRNSFKEGQIKTSLKHGVKGKKFSLIIPTTMGDLRIKRKDPHGKEFFQLFDSITKIKGFNIVKDAKGKIKPEESSLIFSPNISSYDPTTRFLAKDTLHTKDDIAIKEDWFLFDFSHNFLLKMGYCFPEGKRRDFLLRLSKDSPLWNEFLSFLDKEEDFKSYERTPLSIVYKDEASKKEKSEKEKEEKEVLPKKDNKLKESYLANNFLQKIINEALQEGFPSLNLKKEIGIGSFNPGTRKIIYQVKKNYIDIFFRSSGSSSFDNMIYEYSLDPANHAFSSPKEGNSYSHKKLKEDFFKDSLIEDNIFY